MNAKQVLNKILTVLSLEKEEVLLTYAKLADGTILESPTFDVGENVEVVSEDGTKSPAPNGEHEVILKDTEGNDVRIKVMTTDGKITERENVELESIAGGDMGDDEAVATDETAEPIDEDMKKHDEMKKVMEEMTYRIDELEKKMDGMMVKEDLIDDSKPAEKVKTEELPGDKPENMAAVDGGDDEEEEDDEEELPKLDGAPIEENAQKPKTNLGKNSIANPQNSFLSKLYK
jgi:hypothetical protein